MDSPSFFMYYTSSNPNIEVEYVITTKEIVEDEFDFALHFLGYKFVYGLDLFKRLI